MKRLICLVILCVSGCKVGKTVVSSNNIENSGNTVTDCVYEELGKFSCGLAKAKYKGEWGFINREGEVAVPFKYDMVFDFSEGFASVYTRDEYGGSYYEIIDTAGNVFLSEIEKWGQIVYASPFSEGISCVSHCGNTTDCFDWLLLDTLGNQVPLGAHHYVGQFSEGLALIRDENGVGFINKNGDLVIPQDFLQAGSFHDGLAWVRNRDGLCGYITKKGQTFIPFDFDKAGDFSDGFARVRKDGKYGYLNMTGNLAIPFQYDKAGNFKDGYAFVQNNKECFVINKSAESVIRLNTSFICVATLTE